MRRSSWLKPWSRTVLASVLFIVAVSLIGAATDAAQDSLAGWFEDVIEGPGSALGAGWIATYVVTNGSVVSGLSVSLVATAVVEPSDGFLLLAGSRLGASAFVIVLGYIEYARAKPRPELRDALGLGLLTYIVTLTVYIPATVLGYFAFGAVHDRFVEQMPEEIDPEALLVLGYRR